MNGIDIAIILLLLIGIWRGFKKGFVIAIFTFLALFLGLYAGIHFSDYLVVQFSGDEPDPESYLPTIAFVVCFLAVGAMVYFGGKAFEKVVKVVQLSLLNKLAGAFLGLFKAVLICGALIVLLNSFDERNDFISDKTKQESFLYYPVSDVLTFCIPAFETSTLYLKSTMDAEDEPAEEESNARIE